MPDKKDADTLEAKEQKVGELNTELTSLRQQRLEREQVAQDEVRRSQLDAEIARLEALIARERAILGLTDNAVQQVAANSAAVVEQQQAVAESVAAVTDTADDKKKGK